MTAELEKAARAIAEVRDRYTIDAAAGHDGIVGIVDWCADSCGGKGPIIYFGTRAECQAWIDCEAARACFESVLPVGDELAFAMAGPMSRDKTQAQDILTAAIRYITTGGKDAGK